MSVFCSSSPSKTASSLVSKVAHRQVLSFLYPLEISSKPFHFRRERRPRRTSEMVSTTVPTLEAWFIESLASAGHCVKHTPEVHNSSTFFTSRRPEISPKRQRLQSAAFKRRQSTQVAEKVLTERDAEEEDERAREYAAAKHLVTEPNRTKEELMELVDQYTGDSYTDQLPVVELPSLYQPSDGPNLTVSDKVEDEWPPPHYAWPADIETKRKIMELELLVEDQTQDPQVIYNKYRELPSPRAPYLESICRHRFLRRLYTIERKNEQSMLRYLSVVDDMKNAAIPLTTIEWNSAISFAARYVRKSTELEVEGALHMWREMEQVAGVKASDATFNILFDVACKAGKFDLADMIYNEMDRRGLEYNRFHHVSLIHYYGLRKNGDGARAAYKAMVEAGEIIDTVVLNAMIAALVSSYEANAAELIYERMKRMYNDQDAKTLPPKDYRNQRKITQALKRIAILAKDKPELRAEFQKRSIIAPNLHTYRILISYFAIQAGELDKTAKLLEEMKTFDLSAHGALFLALLKGFSIHGGIRYTDWTSERLDSVWKSLLTSVVNGDEDLKISRWMVVWALRAFSKCEGRTKTLAVWEEIKEIWHPDEVEMGFVMDHLRPLIEKPEEVDQSTSWIMGV